MHNPLDLVPIREASQRTGVNPVTLRAWERRYGLLKPQRTGKGHRLYDQRQIERIQEILAWLARGVAISQVRELLGRPPSETPSLEDDWQRLRQEWLRAAEELSERRLDALFNEVAALYPPRTLVEQLMLPTLTSLERRHQRFGARLEYLLLHGWLRSKLGARILHDNARQSGPAVLLASLDMPTQSPGLWLNAWLCSCSGLPVSVLDGPVPLNELAAALERLAPRAVVLCAERPLDSILLQQQLPRLLGACRLPVLLSGAAAAIHREALSALPGLLLSESPLASLALLGQETTHG